MFVLPLAKPGGYVTLVTQQQLPVTLVTTLEEFQRCAQSSGCWQRGSSDDACGRQVSGRLVGVRRYGAGAPASITITHYPELLDSAKVVLVRADIVNDKLINQAEVGTRAGETCRLGRGGRSASARVCQPPAAQARTVLELLRALYTDGEDYKMVLDFNHQPEAFSFDALLAKMGIKPALPEAPAAAAERKTPS